VEIRVVRKAFQRPGNSGVPYQRNGKIAPSLVAVAPELLMDRSDVTCPGIRLLRTMELQTPCNDAAFADEKWM
jgi:hypothetical protein